jgi:hypothetical protein
MSSSKGLHASRYLSIWIPRSTSNAVYWWVGVRRLQGCAPLCPREARVVRRGIEQYTRPSTEWKGCTFGRVACIINGGVCVCVY